jgi:RND family efflux transporter MFP subunit
VVSNKDALRNEPETGAAVRIRAIGIAAVILSLLGGCGGEAAPVNRAAAEPSSGTTMTVSDTTITATFEAAGVAEPIERATLSTKLMGSVTEVMVREGDRVARGQLLARIDARELDAKRSQVDAGIAAAEAMYQDAQTQAARFRALYADSAATRYQLDQAETGLARADAGLRTARASRAELDAMGAYAEIRAPFAGKVSQRFVDAGAFVAPGAPIVEVQDGSRLRVSVSVPPQISAALLKGASLEATVEGRPVRAFVEGAVPAPTGAVYTVNAMVDNRSGEFLPGSAATIAIPDGVRRTILIPTAALVQEGDLTGVRVKTGAGSELRWVKTGAEYRIPNAEHGVAREPPPYPALGTNTMVEVLSGLRSGDVILLGSH